MGLITALLGSGLLGKVVDLCTKGSVKKLATDFTDIKLTDEDKARGAIGKIITATALITILIMSLIVIIIFLLVHELSYDELYSIIELIGTYLQ